MQLFVVKHSDTTEQEQREINTFRRNTIQAYLQVSIIIVSIATMLNNVICNVSKTLIKT